MAEPEAAAVDDDTLPVVRLGTEQGGDPLVRTYLDTHRADCAFRILSWPWVFGGAVAAVAGGLAGNQVCGPLAPPDWAAPGSLVAVLHPLLGQAHGVVGGMVAGAVLAGLAGRLTRPQGVSAAHEPLIALPFVVLIYLVLRDALVAASVATGLACAIYLGAILFRLLALLLSAGHRGERRDDPAEPPGGWPVYTVLVPLYRETQVAEKILRSLEHLDYPRDRLDVKLLLEADDPATLAAVRAAGVPDWIEVVVVPQAQPKTKPRACNHGLARARGDLLVIYDAEDRPEPDQLKQAAAAFAALPPKVVCLQAHLAYHNHAQNLLTRWFTVEYNVWFSRFLPGLVRLGVPIPLGGTSNHFRTSALRQLGGWDPFNVTEDCDLGIRLHLAGWRTRILDSITWEEANSRVGNWLRQRSRWLKGYLVTHLVWCRQPLRLLWRLGPWGVFGFLVVVFGVAGLAVLNLPLWIALAALLVLLGIDLSHGYGLWELLASPGEQAVAHERMSWQMIYLGPEQDPLWSSLSVHFFAISTCLLAANLLFVLINVWGGRRKGQPGLVLPALLSPFYWVLISLGAWKGLWQLIVKPHYWEKTVHGLDAPSRRQG